jgi:thioredoxin-related protein
MKIVWLFVFVFVFFYFPASAQTTAGGTAAVPASAATEKTAPPIEREKFDPERDPAADLLKAVEQASAEHKRIILDVGGEWCVWCRYMDRFFILHPELNALKEKNFVWVKVTMDEKNQNKPFLSGYPAISGYPHFFILDEKGKLLKSQSTAVLESDKTYDLQKFIAFFKTWAPPEKKPADK